MIEISKAVNYILDEVNILEYLTDFEGMDFKKFGSNYREVCPIHADKDPSFTITDNKNVWYCFGCNEGGSLITFIEKKYNLNRISAIITILSNLGLKIEDYIINNELEISSNILEDSLAHFTAISTNSTYHKYFVNKGCEELKVNTIRNKYGVGYSDNEQNLHDHLYSRGYTKDQIMESGLYGQRFNNSIVFPIYNVYSRLVGFQCRSLEGEVKYIGDKNDDYIVGIHKLKPAGYVILVEGYTEWMSLHMNGFNAISMRGLKLNEDLIKLLNSYEISDIYIWTDGDMAGLKFINKLVVDYVNLFDKFNINAYAIYVDGQDPDNVVFSGTNIQFLIDNAKLLPEFFLERKYKHLDAKDNYKFINYTIDLCKGYNYLLINKVIGFLASITGVDKIYIEDKFLAARNKKNGDYQVEVNVISCLLYGYKVDSDVELSIDYFMFKSNKIVFELISNKSATVENIRLLSKELWIDNYIGKLPSPNYDKLNERIKILRSYKEKRDLLDISQKVLLMSDDIDSCVSYINDKILNIVSNKSVVIHDFYDSMRDLTSRIADGQQIFGHDISKQFPVMNRVLYGIMPGKLILLMGVTGHGKTNLALNIAKLLSFNQSVKGLYFCGEMPIDELSMRFMSIISGVSNTDIYTNNVDDNDMQKIIDANVNFSSDRLKFNSSMQFDKIMSTIKYMYLKHKIGYVVIDYLQLVEAPSYMNRKDRTYQLKEMTRKLKNEICNTINIPVIVLGQLSDQALDDSTPLGRRSSESKLIQADADVTIAMRMKNKKELSINPAGNIICHIDKVRYNKGSVTLLLQFNDIDLTIKEVQS